MSTLDYSVLRPQTSWPRVAAAWEDSPSSIYFGHFMQPGKDGLAAIVTVDLASDVGAGDWLHISVSRARRLPTWGDLVSARDALGYGELYFVQQLPPRRHWLNVHSHCLHLLHRLDAETVPRLLWAGQEGATGERYEHAP